MKNDKSKNVSFQNLNIAGNQTVEKPGRIPGNPFIRIPGNPFIRIPGNPFIRIPGNPVTKFPHHPMMRMASNTNSVLESFASNENVEPNWQAFGFSKKLDS